ncbi:MAG: hypothetical protein H0U52_09510 [Chloroflexi bacterium]|nr:hypothetical protein [Chloroflexota bacterium]
MKPPRPVFVIVILFVLAVMSASRIGDRTGALAAGYLFGAIFFPALIAGVYVWWYRRRERQGS